jgi:hypothetical protein
MNRQQIHRAQMLRALRKRRTATREHDSYALDLYLTALEQLDSKQGVKHYEPYLRLTDTSPPQPDKHLFALGSITNLDPPKTPTALSGITTAGTPVGAL